MSTKHDILAIDTVVNIFTPEALMVRPKREAFFNGKMRVNKSTMDGDRAPGLRPHTLRVGGEGGVAVPGQVLWARRPGPHGGNEGREGARARRQ